MRLLLVFILCQALFSAALAGSRPIVTLHADIIGVSPLVIGLLVSSFAFLPMVFAIRVGKWLDRLGAKRVTLIGGIGMLAALFLPILIPTIHFLFLSQFIIGIAHVCTLIALQKTVGNLPGDRDKIIAMFSLAGSFGEFIGPLLTGVLYQHAGFRLTFMVMAVTAAIALIISFVLAESSWQKGVKMPASVGVPAKTFRETWQMLRQINLRKALIISGLVLYSKDLFVAYFPVYGNNVGLSPVQIGFVIALSSAMAIIVRLMQFHLVHRFGRGLIMMSTLIISGIAFFFLPVTGNFILLCLLSLLLGAGLGLGQPLSLVFTMNMSPPERQGEILGLRLTFNRGSQFIAPPLFGIIGLIGGISSVFLVSGSVLLLGAYLTRIGKEDNYQKEVENTRY